MGKEKFTENFAKYKVLEYYFWQSGIALHSNHSISNLVLPDMDFDGLFLYGLRVSQAKVRPKGLHQIYLCHKPVKPQKASFLVLT